MGYIKWTVGLVTIGLFALAILGFAIGFASDNNAPISLANDPEIVTFRSQGITNTTGFKNNVQDTTISILNSTISPGDETTEGGAQFKLTPTNSLGAVKNMIELGYLKVFGSNSNFNVFMFSFLAILVFVTFMLVMKAWIGRNPE